MATTNASAPTTTGGHSGSTGGIGGGAIDGYLNVYVIDADTNAPLTGAAVQVGASSASAHASTSSADRR